jgi:hypothetical protein
MPVGEVISYREAMKLFNQDTFGSSLWGIPRKGYASYNAVQNIRKGEPHEKFTTIADLKRAEAPVTVPTKKQQEKAKDDKKKADEEAKKKADEEAKKKAEQDANKKRVIKLKKTVNKVVEEKKQLENAVTKIQEVVAQESPQIAQEVKEIVKSAELPVIEMTSTIPDGMFFGKKEDETATTRILSKQMNPTLRASLEKIKKGRNLKNLYMDGKTKDESGASMYEQGLNDYYEFMAYNNGVSNKEEAFKFLPDYMKWYNELMGKTPESTKTKEVTEIVKPVENSKTALEKLEDEIKEAEKKAKDYLKEKQEIESTKTTKTLQRWGGAFTKKEADEFNEIDKLIAGKRILKTDPIAKEYTKKMKELETRALKGVQERSAKLRKLRQDLDDLVEKKLLMTGAVKAEDKEPSGKMFSIEDSMDLLNRFSRKGSAKQEEVKKMAENVSKAVDINPDEDWRAKMGYNDTVWEKSGSQYIVRNEFNRNSQLPKEFNKEQGYRWLEEKYGDLYKTAIEKTKMLGGENRVSMTEKQLKEARRLEFKDGNQMKEFFRDVLLADPIIYSMLNINAHKTKAPATTNALRDFKKWVGS